jgi:nicotinic acid mononucleotide adenylyltransferase
MQTNKQKPALVFSGSFNPIHTGHIAVLTTIKDVLDHGITYDVVTAYIAPSSDQYVERKLGTDAIMITV